MRCVIKFSFNPRSIAEKRFHHTVFKAAIWVLSRENKWKNKKLVTIEF